MPCGTCQSRREVPTNLLQHLHVIFAYTATPITEGPLALVLTPPWVQLETCLLYRKGDPPHPRAESVSGITAPLYSTSLSIKEGGTALTSLGICPIQRRLFRLDGPMLFPAPPPSSPDPSLLCFHCLLLSGYVTRAHPTQGLK